MGSASGPKERSRQHSANLLLLQNLLSCQPGTSPFTLIQDSVNQSARPLLWHYLRDAGTLKATVIFVSFETYSLPLEVTYFIKSCRKNSDDIHREIVAAVNNSQSKKILLVIDTLHPLCSLPSPFSLATYLSSLLALSPALSLVAIYHLDIPLPVYDPPLPIIPIDAVRPRPPNRNKAPLLPPNPYEPSPLTMLTYLSTTIFTVHSLRQILAQNVAYDRSLPTPVFGIEEEKDGVITPLLTPGSNDGFVLHMEHRRKSGRVGANARFHMPYIPSPFSSQTASSDKPMMLSEHPLFRSAATATPSLEILVEGQKTEDEVGTFNLELTERQRRARDGVVLPYFDAQKGEGAGEGGRILYDMGVEDDFDEEEDEI